MQRCAGCLRPLCRHLLPRLATPVPTSDPETSACHCCMSALPRDVPRQALKTATAGNKPLACPRVWDIPVPGGHGDQPPAPLRPRLGSHLFFLGGRFSCLIPRRACLKVKVSPLQPLVCRKAAALVSGKIQNLPFPSLWRPRGRLYSLTERKAVFPALRPSVPGGGSGRPRGTVERWAGSRESLSRALLSLGSLALWLGGDVTAKNIWLAESVLDVLTEQR